MRIFVDTHTLIWFDSSPDKLSARARSLLEPKSNEILVSVASVWEMQIKKQLGKISLRLSLEQLLKEQRQNDLQFLPITDAHVLGLAELPLIHGDPFDRLIIAAARFEKAAIITVDPVFQRYPVEVIW